MQLLVNVKSADALATAVARASAGVMLTQMTRILHVHGMGKYMYTYAFSDIRGDLLLMISL